MATAHSLYTALGTALGLPWTAIEPYGAALRKGGQWPPTKPGRGAIPLTDTAVACLIIAILLEGPSSVNADAPLGGGSLLLTYANATPDDASINSPIYAAMRDRFGLASGAKFADWIAAFVRLFADGKADDVLRHHLVGSDRLDPVVYGELGLRAAIRGPFPVATIEFFLSASMIDEIEATGVERASLVGPIRFVFLDLMYGLAREARMDGRDDAAFVGIILMLREATARGIEFERAISWGVFSNIGLVMRND